MESVTIEATELSSNDVDYIADMLSEIIAERLDKPVGALGFKIDVWFSVADEEG